jgi:hypothetical protein
VGPAELNSALDEEAGMAVTRRTVPGGDDFGWAGFPGTADLYWRRLPKTWYEGPFLGNGFLGSGIYAEPGGPSAPWGLP